MRVVVTALLALALALALGCASTPPASSSSSAEPAATRDEKDRAACRKMCEMAGDEEGNTSAVADCQAKCDAETGAP